MQISTNTPAEDAPTDLWDVIRTYQSSARIVADAEAKIEAERSRHATARATIVREMNRQGLRAIKHEGSIVLAIMVGPGEVRDVVFLPVVDSMEVRLSRDEPPQLAEADVLAIATAADDDEAIRQAAFRAAVEDEFGVTVPSHMTVEAMDKLGTVLGEVAASN